MKYTFVAALFMAALNATETATEVATEAAIEVESDAEQRRRYVPVPIKKDLCNVDAWKDQQYLDTDDYQRLPASCKLDIIWERISRSKVVQRFFTGSDM